MRLTGTVNTTEMNDSDWEHVGTKGQYKDDSDGDFDFDEEKV